MTSPNYTQIKKLLNDSSIDKNNDYYKKKYYELKEKLNEVLENHDDLKIKYLKLERENISLKERVRKLENLQKEYDEYKTSTNQMITNLSNNLMDLSNKFNNYRKEQLLKEKERLLQNILSDINRYNDLILSKHNYILRILHSDRNSHSFKESKYRHFFKYRNYINNKLYNQLLLLDKDFINYINRNNPKTYDNIVNTINQYLEIVPLTKYNLPYPDEQDEIDITINKII